MSLNESTVEQAALSWFNTRELGVIHPPGEPADCLRSAQL
jgi:hypothetical protein